MTIPVWPATPFPQRWGKEGFDRGSPDGRLKQQTDIGPGKSRRRYSAAVIPVSGQIDANIDTLSRFERFWKEDTKGGELPFLVPDQVLDGQALLSDDGTPLLTDDGTPLLVDAWWLAIFDQQAPHKTPLGGQWWRIAFQVNVLP
jgi:fermentation-respiration switch protein FrsA (DUF1100 family)